MASAPDPKAVAARQRAEVAQSIKWEIGRNGKVARFLYSELTALEAGALKAGPGLTIRQVTAGVAVNDLVAVAAAWWLACRQSGEPGLEWESVLTDVKAGDEMYIAFGDGVDDEAGEDTDDAPDPPV